MGQVGAGVKINHRPCLTDEEISWRIFEDLKAIERLEAEGYPVKSKVSYHSPTSLETHAVPIFTTDTMEDVCNRYFDFFPKECKGAIEEVAAMNQSLYHGNAMSESKTVMAYLKIPCGLSKMLDVWHPYGNFWDFKNNKRQIRAFANYMSKLKFGTPYGQSTFQVDERAKQATDPTVPIIGEDQTEDKPEAQPEGETSDDKVTVTADGDQ